MNQLSKTNFLYILLLFVCEVQIGSVYAQSNVVDEVVWVVGDEAILLSDVEKVRVDYGNQMNGNPYCVIPEQLAIQKLFLHQANIDSVEVDDAEINQYVEQSLNQRIQMAGSQEKLEEYMKMTISQIREVTFDLYKNELTAERMKGQLTSHVKTTPAEVRRYFKDLPEDSLPLIPTQVEVQVIVINPVIPIEEVDRVKAELRGYAERVNNGTSFATLARLYSEDVASARQGGELPYYGRAQLDPAFSAVAFSMNDPKKVSKIVHSEFGYHIIQLIDKRGDKVKCRHILRRPQVQQENIDATLSRLDSIREDIRNNKFSFEEGASIISEDKETRNNHGLLSFTTEEEEQTTRFEMGQLANVYPELAREVEKMDVGEISNAFTMTNSKGAQVCVIARLRSRIAQHRANVSEDFQVLQKIVEARKKEEVIQKWIQEKQKSTYIRINENWRDCEFQYPGWVKQ